MSQFSQFYKRQSHSPANPNLEDSDDCDASLSSNEECDAIRN